MAGHRLFIDIPLEYSEEEATQKSLMILKILSENIDLLKTNGVGQINYRLGHDEDRQTSNYLIKTDTGHVSNKKCKIIIDHTQ